MKKEGKGAGCCPWPQHPGVLQPLPGARVPSCPWGAAPSRALPGRSTPRLPSSCQPAHRVPSPSASLSATGNAAAAAGPRFLAVLAARLPAAQPYLGSPGAQPGWKHSYLPGHLPVLLGDTEVELELLVALGDGVSPSGFGAEESRLREVQ